MQKKALIEEAYGFLKYLHRLNTKIVHKYVKNQVNLTSRVEKKQS